MRSKYLRTLARNCDSGARFRALLIEMGVSRDRFARYYGCTGKNVDDIAMSTKFRGDRQQRIIRAFDILIGQGFE